MESEIAKETGWIGPPNHRLFTCVYHSKRDNKINEAILVCPPIGFEYTHTHRIISSICELLARVPNTLVMKFDFSLYGNSLSTNQSQNLLQEWSSDVSLAFKELNQLSPNSIRSIVSFHSSTLITLTAIESSLSDCQLNKLLLINPYKNGASLIRDLELLNQQAPSKHTIDIGGITKFKAQLKELETATVDRLNCDIENIILLHPERSRISSKFTQIMKDSCQIFSSESFKGNDKMMLPPLNSMVSQDLLDKILNVFGKIEGSFKNIPSLNVSSKGELDFQNIATQQNDLEIAQFTEQCVKTDFGNFGVLCRSQSRLSTSSDLILILLNAGAAHHSGPSSLYTNLARNLASLGMDSLRLDFCHIGEGSGVYNQRTEPVFPYPESRTDEIDELLDKLEAEHGYTQFILGGLCSAGHNAFQYILHTGNKKIIELLFVNPLSFYKHDKSLVDAYTAPASAKSLLKAMILQKRFKVLFSLHEVVKLGFRASREYFRKRFQLPGEDKQLIRDLEKLSDTGIRLNFIFNKNDVSLDYFSRDVGRAKHRLSKHKNFKFSLLPDGDHAFTLALYQTALMARLENDYCTTEKLRGCNNEQS